MSEYFLIRVERDDFPPHTEDNFLEWLEWRIGQRREIDADNPLAEFEIEARLAD